MTNTSSTFEKTAQSPKAWWDDFQLATVFLTRLPWRIEETLPPQALNRALRCFPLVGLLVGGFSATVFILSFYLGLPALICALLSVLTATLITGALHEDGLADVADGFGGGYSKERKLEIMRDSRVGSYGVLALIFAIGLRVVALAEFETALSGAAAIVGVALLSRLAPALLLYALPPARHDGLAATMDKPDRIIIVQAASLGVGLFILTQPPLYALIALIVCAFILWGFSRIVMKQIGGHTGDVCGASQQIVEITALISLVAMA